MHALALAGRRRIAVILAALMAAPLLASGFQALPAAAEVPDSGSSEVQENLALNASAVASSSYEAPTEMWSVAMSHDGSRDNTGWTTNPYERVQDPATPATLTFDLCAADITKLVVAPLARGTNFPRDYRLQVSSDGSAWETVVTSTGNPGQFETPQEFQLESPTSVRYVRLYVDVRNGPSGGDGYLAQISEFEIYGQLKPCLDQVKPALLLPPGATDAHWFEVVGLEAPFTVVSSDPSVATVDENGAVTAVAEGTTEVTLTAGGTTTTLTLPVEVSNYIERVGDEFAIAAFWPPTLEYVNEEQYDNLADAGIDLLISHANNWPDPRQMNLDMARLAYERGMQIVANDEFPVKLPTMTSQQVKDWANTWRHIPGVGGLFLMDEPPNPLDYATAYNAVREEAPELYPHLNFSPYYAYGGEAASDKAMQDWLNATNGRSVDDPDFLSYDLYPFAVSSTDFQGMFTNLNTVRELGLQNTVKTGTYLQSVGIPGYLRRPVPAEIRYEANIAMAYGFKELAYFTWWTPTGRGQTFTDAIIAADGQKTDLYEPVKQLNTEIHALGDTLMGLEAEEVYLSGTAYGQPTVPADFFVQSEGQGDLVLSRMVDRETGEEYLFVVNNSFTAGQDMELTFDDSIGAVREVSREDGTLGKPIELKRQSLTRQLAASEGVLYQLVREDDDDQGARRR